MENKSSGNGGIGVLGLLGIVFIVLKLTGYIDWSWFWVTAPFWIGLAVALLFLCIMFVSLTVSKVIRKLK